MSVRAYVRYVADPRAPYVGRDEDDNMEQHLGGRRHART